MKRSELPKFDRSVVIALGDATKTGRADTPLAWFDAREVSQKSGLRILTADLERLEVYELVHFQAWKRGPRVTVRYRLTPKGQRWRLFYKRQHRMAERIGNA